MCHWPQLLLPLGIPGSFPVPCLSSHAQLRHIFSRATAIAFLVSAAMVFMPISLKAQEEKSSESSPTFETPPAPILSPAEELKTIQLVDGYALELVAAEPLIQDPIAITFDPRGRLWVCEMRGFMPNIDGEGEEEPVGVISVLEDTDGDGQADKSTVFQDGLVLPRGLCWTSDGILVCENGTIWLCTDTDGDDRSDKKTVVCTYRRGNLEHALNGLMPALDNWIYNAKEGIRIRQLNGQWVKSVIAGRGQWGITQDNHGYLHYNVNASLIRGDRVPCYSTIAMSDNPYVDVQLYDSQEVFPIRPTPGINRGYIPGFLRPDGSMVEANSNCGPVIYRGDNLPADLQGNSFVPDPAGNLIRRQLISWDDNQLVSANAYDQLEFLASTDERFRPVNMYNAPDGTLYIVDMYRGVIQHGAFITSYLRDQILDRELDQGVHLGRIWRLVHRTTKDREHGDLAALPSEELVPMLSHPNGWHRDMAQQLIVQRGDLSILSQLEQHAVDSPNPLGRLHALWALDGLGNTDPDLLFELLSDEDEHVRASAVTQYSRMLGIETMVEGAVEDLSELQADSSPLVRMQVSQILGLTKSGSAREVLSTLLSDFSQDEDRFKAVIGGFSGREIEFLEARINQPSWQQEQPWRTKLLGEAAASLWKRKEAVTVLRLSELIGSIGAQNSWQQIALLDGAKDPPARFRRRFPPPPGSANTPPRQTGAATTRPNADSPRPNAAPRTPSRALPFNRRPQLLELPRVPQEIVRLAQSDQTPLQTAATSFLERVVWPGKDGKPLPQKRTLTPDQTELWELGKQEYENLCAGCHHQQGFGLAAKGPYLVDSDWLADQDRLIKLVLNGIEGPIAVNGELYNQDNRLVMPPMKKALNDRQIAAVLTFIRRDFANDEPPVTVERIAHFREQLADRDQPWHAADLTPSQE